MFSASASLSNDSINIKRWFSINVSDERERVIQPMCCVKQLNSNQEGAIGLPSLGDN
jgi:hypothetical protein